MRQRPTWLRPPDGTRGEVAQLGVEFLTEARRVIYNAAANPFLYPAISRRAQVRRALTYRFPYRVF